ncbi:MAG: hypothetical protein D3926_13005 [Desulfobacteraceae bacterium]|nr:MAG: hypothetical protein D3926_13005 [Desulfobacteraceae bacterium]
MITAVCDEIIDQKLDNLFSLKVWQTGSLPQTNKKINEVIANRAHHVLVGNEVGKGIRTIYSNDGEFSCYSL